MEFPIGDLSGTERATLLSIAAFLAVFSRLAADTTGTTRSITVVATVLAGFVAGVVIYAGKTLR